MADTTPEKSGIKTSEFQLTALAMVIGTILEGSIVPVLEKLQPVMPNAHWIGIVLGICGVVLQVLSLLGYVRSRTMVKAAMIAADAPNLAPPPK